MFRNDLANASADVLCSGDACIVETRFEMPPDHTKLLPPSALRTMNVVDVPSHCVPRCDKTPEGACQDG